MNLNPFTKFNTDCFQVLLSTMSLGTVYQMSCTCKPYYKIFMELLKENRVECCLLLESGKKYTAVVEPCILELKTDLLGNLLLNKQAFVNYATALSRTIAENFSEPALTSDPDSEIYVECITLIADRPLFTLLCQHGFCSHLAQAFLEKYKAHKNNHLFFLFCQDMVNKLGNGDSINLETVFEDLYAGWKLAFYSGIMAECKNSPAIAQAVIADLKTFDPAFLLEQEDVKGLAAIDQVLHLHDQERATLLQRMRTDIPLLFGEMTKELAISG